MNREKLQQQLQELEEKAKQIREELNKPEELHPFDYNGKNPYLVAEDGVVWTAYGIYNKRRYSKTRKGAEILAKQHRWQVLMQSLRDSLGCGDYEFKLDGENWKVYLSRHTYKWDIDCCYFIENPSVFHFPTKEDALKVVDYLNKHYPDGFK